MKLKVSKVPKSKYAGVKVSSSRVVRVKLKSGTVRAFRAPNKRSVRAIKQYADEHNLVAM